MSKTIKILGVLLLALFVISINTIVKAASMSWNAPGTVEVGTAINVSGSVTAAQWNLTVKVNGYTIITTNELVSIENSTKAFSGTYTPSALGTLTITITGDYTDANRNDKRS